MPNARDPKPADFLRQKVSTKEALAILAICAAVGFWFLGRHDESPQPEQTATASNTPDASPTPSAPPLQSTGNQAIDDARAAVRDEWAMSRASLVEIELAFACGVVDKTSANAAMRKSEQLLFESAARAGLASDSAMDSHAFVLDAVKAGSADAKSGACDRLTPADRGRMRMFVNSLVVG